MERKIWHSLVKPSSLEFFRQGRRAPGYSLYDWLHGYVYARWTYLYIGIGTGEHHLAKIFRPVAGFFARLFPARPRSALTSDEAPLPTFADGYHGKVVPLQSAVQLVMVNEEIKIQNLEKIIPYARARDIILQNPQHILALECPCRSSRQHPCLPLDVCLIIGDPFASFVEEHHPQRSRRLTSEEAVEILRAEESRGHVHHAFFKDAMLGRFYAICNCCACCCGAIQAHQHGTPMLASSGFVSRVDQEKCIACGDCADHCQFGALTLAEYSSIVDEQSCMGCGVCVSQCAQGALSLERAPAKGDPLEIFHLMQQAERG
jgi:ferredoxin